MASSVSPVSVEIFQQSVSSKGLQLATIDIGLIETPALLGHTANRKSATYSSELLRTPREKAPLEYVDMEKMGQTETIDKSHKAEEVLKQVPVSGSVGTGDVPMCGEDISRAVPTYPVFTIVSTKGPQALQVQLLIERPAAENEV
ncbi:hypothetical protein NDU88_005210 [Pleurodeles waltl]|uniref:Uncharacterized protein n=1 Tax=Pleurodeles waltl TaxID=8319 RepID=A0AAV7PHX0_PLEWA|nr:hypothetical protein NDU88_005210 [Pleurodeles waltl]